MSAFNGTCCDALAAIARLCEQHALGISTSIDIIEACDIESMPAPDADTNTISGDIVVKTGKQWYNWKIGGNAEFNYNSVGSQGNQSFENILTPFLPLVRDAITHLLNQIVNGEFVIRFSDIGGEYRLLGTEFSPAMVAEGGIQGVISAEANGTTITFNNKGLIAYTYTGAVSYTPAA